MKIFYQQLIKWLNETHDVNLMRETDPIVDIDVYNTGEETMLTGILKIIIQENDSKDINIKDSNILLHILGKGAKINQPNAQRQLPLEIAVQNNGVGIVNTLLCLPKTTYSRGWDPVLNLQISIDEINSIIQIVPEDNSQMRKLLIGHTLMIAAARNDVQQVQKILLDNSHIEDLINTTNLAETALTIAARYGCIDTVKLLLNNGASTQRYDSDEYIGRTALSIAIENNQLEIVRFLLDNHHFSVDDSGASVWGSALLSACSCGNLNMVKVLITEYGADVNLDTYDGNYTTMSGSTPLTAAAYNGYHEIVEYLLEKEADPDQPDESEETSAILFAGMQKHEKVFQILIDHGADVLTPNENYYGLTPLACAAANGLSAIVQTLITQHGADIHYTDADNQTVLIHAAMNGHTDIVQTLITQHGADINHRDINGQTALTRAVIEGHIDTAQMLVEQHGIDINHRDINNQTALIHAVMKGHTDVVDMLINRGADIKIEDRHLHNALIHAVSRCNNESHYPIIKMLLEKSTSGEKVVKNISNHEMIDLLAEEANKNHLLISILLHSKNQLFEATIKSGAITGRIEISERSLLSLIGSSAASSSFGLINTISKVICIAHHGLVRDITRPIFDNMKIIIERHVSKHITRESQEMTKIAVTISKLVFNMNLDLNIEDNEDKRMAQLTFTTLVKLNLDFLISPLLKKTGLTINDAMPCEYDHLQLTPLVFCSFLGNTKALKEVAKIVDESSLDIRRTTSSGSSDYGTCPAAKRQAR